MKSTKRSVAIIFSIIFICLILLTGSLIATKHGQDCIGENCNVCAIIDAAKKILTV